MVDARFKVDFDRSRGPRAFRGNENLWHDDVRRIYRLVDRHIQALDREQARGDSEPEKLPNLSIAVFGPSGSGKSSLLRTLADDIGSQDEAGREGKSILREQGLAKRVRSLPVMDPITWSETDQFLYAFLAAALEEEQAYQEKRGFPQGLSPVQLAFQEVNEYLRVIDDVGSSEEHDPLGMSLQRLERHTSGLRLRKALDGFIKQLAQTFGDARVVLLPVDDLDMTPTHLVRSLQTYQSFLTHPQLVPVFTFTDRMSEELIEAHYEQRLGKGRRRFEQGTERLAISEQLALQFLARSFPVRNRIRLGPAPARVQRAIFDLRAERGKGRGGNDPASEEKDVKVLELLVISSFLLFGYPDEEDTHKVRAALRPSTLRRQFQVVDAMADCRLPVFRVPQLARMADPKIGWEDLEQLTTGEEPKQAEKAAAKSRWQGWLAQPAGPRYRLETVWDQIQAEFLGDFQQVVAPQKGYRTLADRLRRLEVGATWATIFSGATWSLLNVHRDTLRELGLFLEDLYSWSPKELRSVVIGRILEQNRAVRRTVVDRWFNRTDYRRSQVLSLLAANIFRPWMKGEEPYGDEEIAIREQLRLEGIKSELSPFDRQWDEDVTSGEKKDPVRERLTFPATEGLLWFFNVTLGFYLPQIMARNWIDALSPNEPLTGRIGGNGWDLLHAPINAMRVADAKQEIFSFGMLFLGPRGYRHALEAFTYKTIADLERISKKPGQLPKEDRDRLKELGIERQQIQTSLERLKEQYRRDAEDWLAAWGGGKPSARGHLLLRIWSCCGYSRSRYWAAFSLWRGLGFIGQVLELGLKERERITEISTRKKQQQDLKRKAERLEIKERELEQGTEDHSKVQERLRRIDDKREAIDEEIDNERNHLRPKFLRLIRSHCLQGLMPGSLLDRDADDKRLLQGFPRWDPHQPELEGPIETLADELIRWLVDSWDDRIFPLPAGEVWVGWRDCFIRRIHGEYILGSLWPRLNAAYLEERPRRSECQQWARKRAFREERLDEEEVEKPHKPKHEDRFRWTAALAAGAWSDILLEYWRGCPSILRLLLRCPVYLKGRERFDVSSGRELKQKQGSWLEWLSHKDKLIDKWQSEERLKIPGLVTDDFCIERVRVEFFASRPAQRHEILVERAEIAEFEGDEESQGKRTFVVQSVPIEYPESDKPGPA